MEKSVEIPDGIHFDIEDRSISIKGPKGHLKKDFDDPRFNRFIDMEKHGNKILIKSKDDNRKIKAMIGTISAHTKNMIRGVTNGYSYKLKVVTTHFPITVVRSGNEMHIKNFFGEKNNRVAKIVGQSEIKIDKDELTVTGIDIEAVSQTAANIELACKLKGRDKRIFQDGIYIVRSQTGEAE